jgi:hypothetical protein
MHPHRHQESSRNAETFGEISRPHAAPSASRCALDFLPILVRARSRLELIPGAFPAQGGGWGWGSSEFLVPPGLPLRNLGRSVRRAVALRAARCRSGGALPLDQLTIAVEDDQPALADLDRLQCAFRLQFVSLAATATRQSAEVADSRSDRCFWVHGDPPSSIVIAMTTDMMDLAAVFTGSYSTKPPNNCHNTKSSRYASSLCATASPFC